MTAPSPIRIFYAEDNKTDSYVFEKLLEKIDTGRRYELTISNSYKDALNLILQHRYDVYFIDYVLDESTGTKLVDTAKRKGCDGPFVILTHYDRFQYYEESATSGIYYYLVKSELTSSMIDRAVLYAINRKKVEMKLQYEKSCFNYVIDNIPYAIFHIDQAFCIKSLNKIAPQILDEKEENLLGRDIFSFIHMDEKSNIQNMFFSEGADVISFSSLWRGGNAGEDKTFLWDCVRRNYKEKPAYLCIGKDLTKDLAIDVDDGTGEDFSESLDDIASSFGNIQG